MNEKGVSVEIACLFLMFALLAFLVYGMGLGLGVDSGGRARAYQQLARRFNGSFQPGRWLSPCRTQFRHGQAWVMVTPGAADGRQHWTQATVQWPDHRTDLQLETRSAAPDPNDHARLLVTDDAQFNERFQLRGQSADECKRLLSDAVRWQVNRLVQLPGPAPIRISIQHGRLLVEKALAIRQYLDLEEFTRLCLELFDQAMLTRSEGITFMGAADAAVPLEAAVCQVCGEQIVDDMVCCRRCFTPHHLECWQYNGVCSTYGCGETRCYHPTVAKPYHKRADDGASSGS